MNITVTHTLSPEVLNILEKFVNGFVVIPTPAHTNGNGKGEQANGSAKKLAPVKDIAENKPAAKEVESPAETTTATAPTSSSDIKIEEIRKMVQEKSQAGKKEEVKKLLTKHNAASVTLLAKENYPAFVEDLKKL